MKHLFKKINIWLCFIIVIILISCKNNSIEKETLPFTEGAYEISQGYSDKFKADYLNYKINTEFPAKKIIKFYSDHFKKVGFIPYSEDGYGKSKWENFNYSSAVWESTKHPPARYISTWIDPEKKVRIILIMIFKKEGEKTLQNNSNSSQLFIDLKRTTFFDSRKIPVPSKGRGVKS